MAVLGFGKALKTASELIKTREFLGTGIQEIDRLLAGGFIRGEISEVVGTASSGRTSLAVSALSQATARGEIVAHIDTYGVIDPRRARKAGLDLKRLLWIRCDGSKEKALAAADILLRGGGFGVIALDLAGPDARENGEKGQGHTWFRLKQSLEGARTVFLVLSQAPVSGSLASLVLGINRRQARWSVTDCGFRISDCRLKGSPRILGAIGSPRAGRDSIRNPQSEIRNRSRAALFRGLCCEARILRGKSHGSTTFYCDFRG